MIRAVLFDVDFTLARPGPELGPEGYRRAGERHGLVLEPERYEASRLAALASLQRHPELEHDDELWIVFTEEIVRGMGGDAEGARACAEDLVRAWELHERFTLYEDALPALAALREHGVKIGLVSNGSRDLEEFVVHHALDVDCAIGSRAFGRTKPHPEIFQRALELLDTEPEDAAMIGDSYEDDIEGARALGMKAFLLDRDGRYPDEPDRLPDLLALPAALGLIRNPDGTTVRRRRTLEEREEDNDESVEVGRRRRARARRLTARSRRDRSDERQRARVHEPARRQRRALCLQAATAPVRTGSPRPESGRIRAMLAWAPDGTRVVFTCGNFELCVASADGSDAARLTKSQWPDTLELRLRAGLVARRQRDRLQPNARRAE